jgi:hypothetical protein
MPLLVRAEPVAQMQAALALDEWTLDNSVFGARLKEADSRAYFETDKVLYVCCCLGVVGHEPSPRTGETSCSLSRRSIPHTLRAVSRRRRIRCPGDDPTPDLPAEIVARALEVDWLRMLDEPRVRKYVARWDEEVAKGEQELQEELSEAKEAAAKKCDR